MSEKIISETELEFLVFPSFSNFLMKAFIQEHNLLLGSTFGPFTYEY